MQGAREAHATQRAQGTAILPLLGAGRCPRLQICPHKWQRVRLLHERTTVTILNPFRRPLPVRIHVSAFSWTPRRRDGTRTMPHTMPTKRSPSRRRRKLLRVLGRAVSSPMTSPSHLLLGSQTLTLKECAASGSYTCHRCVGTVGRLWLRWVCGLEPLQPLMMDTVLR